MTDRLYDRCTGLFAHSALQIVCAAIDDLRAKVDGGLAMWQPIETAPREGSFFAINLKKGWGETWLAENYWRQLNDPSDDLHEAAEGLTHWTPLPAPTADNG